MKKIFRNSLLMLAAGALAVSCADYNETDNFKADPDPSYVIPYKDLSPGTTLMSGEIVNAKGVMNFLSMKDLLDHMQEIDGKVYGSPIFANANQADDWLNTLTAPIEIIVEYVEGKTVNFNEMPVGKYDGTIEKGKASIVKYDNQNVLQVGTSSNVRIIEGFDVDPLAKYTTTFWARSDKDITFTINFSGVTVDGSATAGKWAIKNKRKYEIVHS